MNNLFCIESCQSLGNNLNITCFNCAIYSPLFCLSEKAPVQKRIFQLGEDIKLSNRDNVAENIKQESRT